MHWPELAQWGDDTALIEPLTGGTSNDVWRVLIGGRLAVARRGSRPDDDLAWETGLMLHLDRNGLAVPVPIPTRDGRLFSGGTMIMTFMEGSPPQTPADWRRVADTLRRVHTLTRDWPQRPGWKSATDLLTSERFTRIDLTAMPAEAVARCRNAWARLAGRPTAVVHGNPNNPANICITPERVALVDWDEARVDAPEFDLALPHNGAGLAGIERDTIEQAAAAWEAAICWQDDYALRRLAEVRPV